MNSELSGNLRIAVLTGCPRRPHGGIAIRVGFRNRIQRLARGSTLSTRNIDVIRPPPSSLVHTSDKCIVTEEHLTVQMSPDRLTFPTFMHKPLVRRHGSRTARSKLPKKSIGLQPRRRAHLTHDGFEPGVRV